jgi:hypothetical protein
VIEIVIKFVIEIVVEFVIRLCDPIHFAIRSSLHFDPLYSVHVYAQEHSSIYIYIYILVLTCRFNRQSDANTSSWVQQLSCFGQHVCRVYFGHVLSWKLTTHLRLSGLCLLPVACIILSSLAARCLQYPFIACYPSLTLPLALGFVLAARCLHYPFIACCPLLAISFHRLLPVAYITLPSLAARRYLC